MTTRTWIAVASLAAAAAACTEGGGESANDGAGLERASCPESAGADDAADGAGWHFTEVSADVGIEGTHWEAAAYGDAQGQVISREQQNRRRREGPATMTAGASITDVDGDGFEDVFITRVGYPNQLFQNRCGESFHDVAPALGLADGVPSAAGVWGDLDHDGDLDVFVTSVMGAPNRLFVNEDDTFVEQGQARGAASAADVRPTFNLSYGAALGDVNADGHLDIVVNQWQLPANELRRGRSRVLLNDGKGSFADANEQLGLDLRGLAAFTTTIDDIDGDGVVDLLIVSDWGQSRLFRGDGSGGFADVTAASGVGTDENGMGSAVVDIDVDGDLDWFVTAISGEGCTPDIEFGCTGNRLYLNDGAGVFTDATDRYGVRKGGWGWGTAVADFNNDGHLDIVMTNGAQGEHSFNGVYADRYAVYLDDPMKLWVGSERLPLEERATELGLTDTGLGKALVAFDYDRDGDLDILVARTGNTPLLYRNDGGNRSPWLRVLPVDVETGLPVIGARVEVEPVAGGPVAIRSVRAGDTYGGMTSSWTHVGLGELTGPAHEVRIVWPGESVPTVLERVDARQHLVVDRTGVRQSAEVS